MPERAHSRHSPVPQKSATDASNIACTLEARLQSREHDEATIVATLKLLTENLAKASPGFETCSLLRLAGPYIRHIAFECHWKDWCSYRHAVLESLRAAANRSGII